MSLASYSDIQTAIASWLARSGDTAITTAAPDFITLCEARIAYGSGDPLDPDQTFYTRPLRIRPMETAVDILIPSYSVGVVGGTANAITLTNTTPFTSYANGQGYQFTATLTNTAATTVNVDGLGGISLLKGSALAALTGGEIIKGATYSIYDDGTHLILMPGRCTVPLPNNYLTFRNAYIDVTPIQSLDLLTSDQMDRDYPWSMTGAPKAYCIEGDSIRFGPYPDAQYIFRANYYRKFDALSGTTNWLITNKPDVYLYGSLMEAAIFIGDDAQAQKFLRLYRSACNGLQAQDSFDRYSGQELTIRSDVTPRWGG